MRLLWFLQLAALPTKSSSQVISLTPPAVSVHIAAFHLWQLIAECGGKGTYAKAAQPRCLLTNPITCPPSEREGLIHCQGGARLSPSPHPAGMLLPLCGLQEAALCGEVPQKAQAGHSQEHMFLTEVHQAVCRAGSCCAAQQRWKKGRG